MYRLHAAIAERWNFTVSEFFKIEISEACFCAPAFHFGRNADGDSELPQTAKSLWEHEGRYIFKSRLKFPRWRVLRFPLAGGKIPLPRTLS